MIIRSFVVVSLLVTFCLTPVWGAEKASVAADKLETDFQKPLGHPDCRSSRLLLP